MTDKLTPEQRHRTMASIRGKDTKPELIVRKFLWSQGYRYRLNHPRLPGKPDIVMRKYRTCIFINGCFWHKHEGCKYYVLPKSRTEFWLNKLNRNQMRDREVMRKLASMGWHSITIWECELKPHCRAATLESLLFTLNRIFLQDHSVRRPYTLPDEEPALMVAEESVWAADEKAVLDENAEPHQSSK